MERDGGGVRPRRIDQLPILKVGERALDGASRETGGGGDGLMRHADRPMSLLAGLTIKVNVDNVRG